MVTGRESTEPQPENEVVDLVKALRESIERAKRRRNCQSLGCHMGAHKPSCALYGIPQ